MVSEEEWKIIKKHVKQLPIPKAEKIETIKELAELYKITITEEDIREITE